jgi:hypothetical protein
MRRWVEKKMTLTGFNKDNVLKAKAIKLLNESEVMKMQGNSRKRAGVKTALVLLSVFLFLLLFAPVASASTIGDVNNDGVINVQDVVLVMRHVLEIPPPLTAAQIARADVTGTGPPLTIQDVTLIMQYSLGIIDEFPVQDIKVLSVKAINLKEIEITYNQPMDPVTTQEPGNYVFSGFAAANLNDTAVYAEFTDSSNTTVRLVTAGLAVTDRMMPTDLAAKVKISGVKNYSKTEVYNSPALGESLGTIAIDATNPTVVSVTPLGTNHFMVTYSEAVIGGGHIVDNSARRGRAYKIGTTQLTDATAIATDVVITNPSKDLRNYLFTFTNAATDVVPLIGSKTIWVNNHLIANNKVQDYAGNAVPITSTTVNFVQDLTRPTVQQVQIIDRQTVRVTFSEMVQNPATIGLIKWGTSTYAMATKSASSFNYVSGNTYDIGFAVANALPSSGSFKLFIPKEQVVDLSGNQMLMDHEATLTGQPSPEMLVTASGTTTNVVLSFSRDIAIDATITNKANYKIDGVALPLAATVVRTDAKTVTITTTLTHGSHTVSISGLKDAFGDTIPDKTITFDVVDTTAPTVVERLGWNNATTAYGVNRDLLLVSFNKAMKAETLTNATNYRIKYQALTTQALPVGTVITALAGNRAVLIDMPSQGTLNTSAILYVGRLVGGTFYGVTDLAGNPLAPANWEVQPSSIVTTGLDISAIGIGGLAAGNPVVITHNKLTMKANTLNRNKFGKAVTSDFTVKKDGVEVTILSVTPIDTTADGFFDTLEFAFAENTFNASSVIELSVASTLNTTDRFGVALLPNLNVSVFNLIPAQLEGAAVQGSSNPKVLYVTTDFAMSAGQATNMKNSLVVLENGISKAIDNVVQQANNRVFEITMVSNLNLAAEIVVRTLPQASITAIDIRSQFLAADTTGIRADGLASVDALLGNLTGGGALQNNSTVTVTYNKSILPSSVKSGWDGTAGETVVVTANATDNTITIAGVGVLEVTSITTGGTMNTATMGYTPATRELTVTFSTITPVVSGNISNGLIFTANAAIKDSGGVLPINSAFRFIQ